MLYGRKQGSTAEPSAYYLFPRVRAVSTRAGRGCLVWVGAGEFVRLRDECREEWNGTAEPQGDNVIRYRFCNQHGRTISGMSDSCGILLCDERGNAWRGIIE